MDNLSSIMSGKVGNVERSVLGSAKDINDSSVLTKAKLNIHERLSSGKTKMSEYGFGAKNSPISFSKNEMEKKLFEGTTKVKNMTTKSSYTNKMSQSDNELKRKLQIGSNKLDMYGLVKGTKTNGKLLTKPNLPLERLNLNTSVEKLSMYGIAKPRSNVVKPKENKNIYNIMGKQNVEGNTFLKQKLELGNLQVQNKMLAGKISMSDKLGLNRIKQQKGLSMFGDFDKDGKVNIIDCNPRNKKKQGSPTVDGNVEPYYGDVNPEIGLDTYGGTQPRYLEPLPAEFATTQQQNTDPLFAESQFIPGPTEIYPNTSIPTPGETGNFLWNKLGSGAGYIKQKSQQGLQALDKALETQSKPDSLTQQKIAQAKAEGKALINYDQNRNKTLIDPANKDIVAQIAQMSARSRATDSELQKEYEKVYKKEAAKYATKGKKPGLFSGTKDTIAYDAGGKPFIVKGKSALAMQPRDELVGGIQQFSRGLTQGVGMANYGAPAGISRASAYNINTGNMMLLTRGVGEMPYDQKVMQMIGRAKQQEVQEQYPQQYPQQYQDDQMQQPVADNYAVGYKKLPDGRYLNLKTKKVVTYPRGTYNRNNNQYPQ